jgi:hypothetical protein
MGLKIPPELLDRLTARLFRPGLSELRDGSPEAVFLAGLRLRLASARGAVSESAALAVGRVCWRASPLLAMLCVLMLFSLWWMDSAQARQLDPAVRLLVEMTTADKPVPDRDLILDAVLRYRGEEGD